jgi:hypothetical protein
MPVKARTAKGREFKVTTEITGLFLRGRTLQKRIDGLQGNFGTCGKSCTGNALWLRGSRTRWTFSTRNPFPGSAIPTKRADRKSWRSGERSRRRLKRPARERSPWARPPTEVRVLGLQPCPRPATHIPRADAL